MQTINDWAKRHNISPAALAELVQMHTTNINTGSGGGEAWVMSKVRLEAAQKGVMLMRNNVGVLTDSNGRPVRYGLMNESKAQNEAVKSSDLIGWRSVLITPEWIGTTIAQFVARECKESAWKKPTGKRELAQAKFLNLVNTAGGDGKFTNGEGSL